MRNLNIFRTLVCSFAVLMAVACFDDAPIWDEFEDVRNEMSKLESRLDSLEKVVADNVSAIQSMVSVGSITSWSFNAETGKGTITLVDGTKITIDQEIKGYSIITVEKDENGNYFWALCRDGENIPLMIDNKKVPVTVTPALKISADNTWLISVDGGATWLETGINYYTGEAPEDSEGDGSGEAETPEDSGEVVVFESAKVDGDNLILTLVGGTEIKVAIVGEAVFKAEADTLWFSRPNMEKSVAVEMQNVKAYTITEKPEGWNATFDESYLFVTSPEDMKSNPSKGVVKVFVLFENGAQPDILQLHVAYEPMFTLARANGVVSVTLSEHTGEDFTGYVLMGWIKSDYTPEKLVAKLNAEHESLVVRNGSQTYKLEDIIEGFDMASDYIVAAVPYLPSTQVAQGAMKYEISDVASVEAIAEEGDWTVKNLRFDYAELHAVMPVAEYFGGFSAKEIWDTRAKTDILEMLNNGSGMLMSVPIYDGPANGFPDHEISTEINPATEYVIWYVPVDSKTAGQYTPDSFVEFTFTTPDVVAETSIAAPSFTVKDITSGGFTADVTPAANTYKTYAAIVKSTVFAEMTDDDIVRYLVHANQFSEGAIVNTVSKNSFDPSDEVYLLAVSVAVDGKYGTIVKEKVALKQLVYTDDLGVEITGVEYDSEANVTFSLSFKGSPVTMTYMAASYNYYDSATLQALLAKQQLETVATTVEVSKLGGKLTVSGLKVGEEHTFYAVVTDANGNHSYLYDSYTFTPSVKVEYVMSTDTDYSYAMPTVSGKLKKSGTTWTYSVTVTMPSTCTKYWLFCGNDEYFTGDAYLDTDKLATMELELLGETAHESSTSVTYEWNDPDNLKYMRLYMVWMDDKGRCHAIHTINPYGN